MFRRVLLDFLRLGNSQALSPDVKAESDEIFQRLERIAGDERPIIVGPWLSEVGFELLYWIPFLRWVLEKYGIEPDRITAVSRGGVRNWYRGIAKTYLDIFDEVETEEFRYLNEERRKADSLQKHMRFGELDRLILGKLATPNDTHILHPEMMYRLFSYYWEGAAGFSLLTEHTRFQRFTPPTHPVTMQLPQNYIAVKFYERASLCKDEGTRDFIERFILSIAERSAVVCLNGNLSVDDHDDFPMPQHQNLVSLTDWFKPQANLHLQSAVIAGASSVYCTYGGFAYLPLLYGVPVMGFYSRDKHFLRIHGRAAYYLASKMKTSLSTVHIGQISTLISGSV